MKPTIYLICLVLASLQVHSQNHVPNGSFEDYTVCPGVPAEFFKCNGWHQYTTGGSEGGSVDYLNECAPPPAASIGVGIPLNQYGNQAAADGKAYMGCYTSGSSNGRENYKEYAAREIVPLKPWYTYEVSMSVSLADKSGFGTDDLGVYFFQKGPASVAIDTVLQLSPQISYTKFGAVTNKTDWVRLTDVFLSDSAYSNIIIGGFKDANTITKVVVSSDPQSAYYYIDSIVVKVFDGIKVHINDTLFCPGNRVSIPYTVNATDFFQSGNVFTAQLSDNTGDFDYPKEIGKISSTSSGVIDCMIPANSVPSGNYKIRVISSNPVATFYPEVSIGIFRLHPVASNNGPVCEGDALKITVTDTVPGAEYHWTGPDNYNTYVKDTTIEKAKLSQSGIYIANATLDNCTATDTTLVTVKPKPAKPLLVSNSPVVAGTQIEIEVINYNSANTYLWVNPSNTIGVIPDNINLVMNAQRVDSGKYIVYASLDGCEDSASIVVTVLDESAIGKYYIYPVPNNGNFTFEGFSPKDQYIKYKIVNAAGQLIMQATVQTINRKVKENVLMPFVATGAYYFKFRADGKDHAIPFTVLH